MRAMLIENETLTLTDLPTPTAAAGEVLIRVSHAGVNRADVMQLRGKYPGPAGMPDVPGLEVSGVVKAVGAGVSAWKPGDKICALLSGGGYAEYVAVPAGQVLPLPNNIALVQAAALPETFATVWSTVFMQARLQPGEIFLVHGGGSGIGLTAIQLAKWRGARVIATAGSDEKCAACVAAGADAAINYTQGDWAEGVKHIGEVNVLLDMVGGDYISKNLAIMARGGRMVSIAFIRGAKTEVNLAPLLLKHITWIGSTLRSRTVQEKAEICREMVEKIWPALANGTLKPMIDSVFPLKDAEKALAHMQENLNIGKIVLQVGE